jgi:endoglucanase
VSIATAIRGAHYYREQAPAIWFGGFTEGRIVDEGGFTTYTIRGVNLVPGESRVLIWMIGKAASTSRWLYDWVNLIIQECQAAGLEARRLTFTSEPPVKGAASVLVSVPVGSTYRGQNINCRNHARLNRRDDENPSEGQMLIEKAYAADPDIIRTLSTAFFYINDTSKKPAGTPSFLLQRYDLDGVSPPKLVMEPGDGVKIKLKTEYIIPGTKIRIYGANAATDPNMLVLSVGAATRAAAKANLPPNTTWIDETRWPPPAGSNWWNGGTIVFNEGYDDNGPQFEFDLVVGTTALPPEGLSAQLDIIGVVTWEGTASDFDSYRSKGDYDATKAYQLGDYVNYVPNGVKYIALKGVPAGVLPPDDPDSWREFIQVQPSNRSFSFQIKDQLPRYWEVRAIANGSMIDFEIVCPSHGTDATSVALTVENAPPGFMSALAAAASATDSPISFDGSRLARTSSADKLNHWIRFSLPRAGVGKHRLILSDVVGSYIGIQETCVFYADPVLPVDPVYVTGVNVSGGEFGTNPGTYNSNYIYPSRPDRPEPYTHEWLNYVWGLGIRLIRLPMRWARLQRDGLYTPLYGEKDPAAAWNNATAWDIARIDEIIHYWTVTLGGRVLLDLHDYGDVPTGGKVRYDPRPGTDAPYEALIDIWVRIASRYENNPKVWLGLMNEPNGGTNSASRCRALFQTLINAIRGRTNSLAKITVPGTEYSSTKNWVSNGQADAYEDFYDPADNFVFETHNYFDKDQSGHSGVCVAGSQNQLAAVTTWARLNGRKLFMGEVAGGDPNIDGQQACGQVVPAAYAFMRDNKDVWLGWTCWGYGPWWPTNYIFNLNPADYLMPSPPKATMQMFIPFIAEEF